MWYPRKVKPSAGSSESTAKTSMLDWNNGINDNAKAVMGHGGDLQALP
jgi:hypothetical protein